MSLRRITGWLAALAAAAGLAGCDQHESTPTEDDSEYWPTVPVQFSNLQVLPETIGREELILYMRTISRSLGVRCSHCHGVLTEDYAADHVEAKIIAREMMRLVDEFNALTSDRPDATTVTCYVCHRGAASPLEPDIFLQPDA